MAGDDAMAKEALDEGDLLSPPDPLSGAVLIILSVIVLAASRLLGRLPRPQGRHRPSYCQASTSCVEATHGCDCQTAEAKP